MSENLKWKGIITQNEKLKQEMAIKSKERIIKSIVSTETDVDSEYKLHFQNLDQKREIRFLTKTVQELQAQLVVSKKRLSYAHDKLLGKVSNGEVIEDENGIQYIIVPKTHENELKKITTILKDDLQKILNESDVLQEVFESKEKHLENINARINEKKKIIANLVKENDQLKKDIVCEQSKIEKTKEKYGIVRNSLNFKSEQLKGFLKEKDEELTLLLLNNEKRSMLLAEKTCTAEHLYKQSLDECKHLEEKVTELAVKENEKLELLNHVNALQSKLLEHQKENEKCKSSIVQLKLREEKTLEEKERIANENIKEIKNKELAITKMKETNQKLSAEIKKSPKPLWK
ncbi:chromosome partition protein Smc [Hydra vulgaris]|uniref:Chromosome partition protein Smc n=1 Tax=Hydra vulgaris TaxID=6087 RepID=A0ABM4CXW3_HYDVU